MARALIGATVTHGACAGVIVETEAYTDDPASHYVTRPRTAAIMGTGHGHIYIYQIYGVHRCLNVTTDAHGPGAVLIRALEPVRGLDAMRARRGRTALRDLCSGPAKLFEALGLDPDCNGRPVADVLDIRAPEASPEIVATPRIGITRARDLPWRFCLAGSRFLSRR